MPRKYLSRFAEPDALRQIQPAFLVELLRPHGAFLELHRVELPSDAELLDIDLVGRVLLNPQCDAPNDLVDALVHINEMADEEGMQKLLASAASAGLCLTERDHPTPADVAVQVWLRSPEILRRAHVEHRVTKCSSFLIHIRRAGASATEPHDVDSCVALMAAHLNGHFRTTGRGAGCSVFHFQTDDLLTIAIRHGGAHRREGCLTDGKPGTIQFQPMKFDTLVLDMTTWELRMTRGTKRAQWMPMASMSIVERAARTTSTCCSSPAPCPSHQSPSRPASAAPPASPPPCGTSSASGMRRLGTRRKPRSG